MSRYTKYPQPIILYAGTLIWFPLSGTFGTYFCDMSDFDNKNIDKQLVWWIEEKFVNLENQKHHQMYHLYN